MLSKHTRTRLIYDGGKKRRAHRVIMERHLGRPLAEHEDVHHINHGHSRVNVLTTRSPKEKERSEG